MRPRLKDRNPSKSTSNGTVTATGGAGNPSYKGYVYQKRVTAWVVALSPFCSRGPTSRARSLSSLLRTKMLRLSSTFHRT